MKFRVKPGKSFGPGGRFPAGTVLELTEAEALGFKDKLERVADDAPVGLVNEVLDQPVGLKNELGVEVPEDMKLLPKEEELPVSVETEEPDEQSQPAAKPKKPRTQRRKSGEG